MGAARHLSLLPDLGGRGVEWPVPFADGVPVLMGYRGKRVVALASGDPFWYGAGTVFARHLDPGEWRALPGPSTFSLAASLLGWPLERTVTLGLHAAPLAKLRPHLAPNTRAILLLRDGDAVAELGDFLTQEGFGDSALTVMEALGGPRQRVRETIAKDMTLTDIAHPVCVGLSVAGTGRALPHASGLDDSFFDHDGQITKRPVRALALSALAPRPGEHLWDIGAGSGSISVEWLLSDPSLTATAFEPRSERVARVTANAERYGLPLTTVQGSAPDCLGDAPVPDVVFVGGGASETLFDWLWTHLPTGTRVVAHAVTLESEALLATWHAAKGGQMLRIELAEAAPLGPRRGWKSAYPVVQWSVTL